MSARCGLLALLALGCVSATQDDCPGRRICRWVDCEGRRSFASCGDCPGGSIDVRRCQRYDAGALDVPATCENTPCAQPNTCLAPGCGGMVVYAGCCECPAATVEARACVGWDAGAD